MTENPIAEIVAAREEARMYCEELVADDDLAAACEPQRAAA